MFGFHLSKCSKDGTKIFPFTKRYRNNFCMKHKLDMYDVNIPINKINCIFLRNIFKCLEIEEC